MKFGGTSVGDAAAIDRLCGIVSREPRNPLVVVSALSGVTDRLVALGQAASHGHSPSLADTVDEIRSRHMGTSRPNWFQPANVPRSFSPSTRSARGFERSSTL
jgi:aspartokinase